MSDKLKNVILISLDGVRADVAYSNKFSSITSICKDSVTFEKTISAAPLTPISHATILSGLFPYHHGVRHLFLEKIQDEVMTLPQILQNAGYMTKAVVSCPGLNRWYGFDRGFNEYNDHIPPIDGEDAVFTIDVKKRGLACKKAEDVYTVAKEFLNSVTAEQPFMFFLHFFDAHWPYNPPEPFASDFSENLYEGEVSYIDKYLDAFITDLKEKNLYDDTMIVIFADHGEDLNGLYANDHGGETLGHPEEEGHGMLLYDATLHVPLIIKMPNHREINKKIKSQVRLVDIVPTVLDTLGIKAITQFDGQSLRQHINGLEQDLVGYSETHYPRENPQQLEKFPHLRNLKAIRIRDNDMEYKIIFHVNSDKVEVYNLTKDPNEQINLMAPKP